MALPGTNRNKVVQDKYFCVIDKENYGINGAVWFYGNKRVQSEIGMKPSSNAKKRITYKEARFSMPRLVAVMAKGRGAKKETHNFAFVCDPSEAEKALTKLPNVKVTRPGKGSWTIERVYRPAVISRQ